MFGNSNKSSKDWNNAVQNPYQSPGGAYAIPVAEAAADVRAGFLRKTYLHLFAAVLGFVALEAIMFSTGIAESYINLVVAWRWAPLAILGAFLAASWLAQSMAASATSLGTQYAGLSLYVVAEAVIFLPILYIAQRAFPGQHVVEAAALITLALFGALTAVVMLTKADFSFMGTFLKFAGIAAFATVLISFFMGMSLGIWFSALMIVLMCGYILYDTSNVLHHYHESQYVSASLALFASLATLFFYVLRIVMAFSSRD